MIYTCNIYDRHVYMYSIYMISSRQDGRSELSLFGPYGRWYRRHGGGGGAGGQRSRDEAVGAFSGPLWTVVRPYPMQVDPGEAIYTMR